MFKTDRTSWQMHLSPSDLADRCFSYGGVGSPPQSDSECAET